MPLMPMGSPPAGMPPPGMMPPPPGAPPGLMPPDPDDMAPAGAAAMALGPLAAQQQAQMDAQKQAFAQQTLQTALAAIQGEPNPAAAAAQTEPGPMVTPGPGQVDQNAPGGAGGY